MRHSSFVTSSALAIRERLGPRAGDLDRKRAIELQCNWDGLRNPIDPKRKRMVKQLSNNVHEPNGAKSIHRELKPASSSQPAAAAWSPLITVSLEPTDYGELEAHLLR